MDDHIRLLEQRVDEQARLISALSQQLGMLQDKDDILRLQYAYGYFIDNRMFREMADLFTDDDPWMEIGQRGRYRGKDRIHTFLLDVLGEGRWGLLRDEVINHVQQQPLITVSDDRRHAWARSRAQVQGNSPPTTDMFLLADGIYENEYVREADGWKIKGIGVTMTFYTVLPREKIWFHSMPPSETFAPDAPSLADDPALGRQFNPWHFNHPVAGYALAVPASEQ